MNFNDVASRILRSPFYWMMGSSTILIQVTGRKSGREIRLPVNFQRRQSELLVISSRNRTWWKNLEVNPRVLIWISGKQVSVQAVLVLDEADVRAQLVEVCEMQPWLARRLGVQFDAKNSPLEADLDRVALERLFVKIMPE